MNAKRELFVNEYFKCGFNATEAARRAGYKFPNKYGPALVHDEEVEQAIRERLEESTLSANEVLYLLARQATANTADYISEQGIIDWEKIKNDKVQVKRIIHRRGNSSFEFYDAQAALQLLGKHYGIFTEKHDITTNGESLNDGTRYNADERTRAINTLLEAIRDTSNNWDGNG